MTIDAPLAFAFTAGLVATVNPCGFAMLPAYLSYFVGMEDREPGSDAAARLARAPVVGVVVSAGFLAVFAVAGVLIGLGIRSFGDWLPYVSIVIGVALASLGVAMLLGYEPIVNLPRLERGTKGTGLGSLFVFGISYAIASLSCALPVFLAVVSGTTTRSNFASGMAAFGAYALGMSMVLLVLTVALALAKHSIVRRLRSAVRYVDRIGGALLVLAGAYVVYYWTYDLVTDPGTTAGRGPIGVIYDWSNSANDWVDSFGGVRLGLVLALVIGVTVLVVLTRRRPE